MWSNPFFPPVGERPELDPWASPGRISLAPALSRADQMTWDAASCAAVHPQVPVSPLWVGDLLLAHLIQKSAHVWELPPDEGCFERDAQWWRPKWCDVGWYPVVDPAQSLRPIVGGLS